MCGAFLRRLYSDMMKQYHICNIFLYEKKDVTHRSRYTESLVNFEVNGFVGFVDVAPFLTDMHTSRIKTYVAFYTGLMLKKKK